MNTSARSQIAYDLKTPTGLGAEATKDIGAAASVLLADIFALYVRRRISIGICRVRISATTTACSMTRARTSSP